MSALNDGIFHKFSTKCVLSTKTSLIFVKSLYGTNFCLPLSVISLIHCYCVERNITRKNCLWIEAGDLKHIICYKVEVQYNINFFATKCFYRCLYTGLTATCDGFYFTHENFFTKNNTMNVF